MACNRKRREREWRQRGRQTKAEMRKNREENRASLTYREMKREREGKMGRERHKEYQTYFISRTVSIFL